MTTFDKHKYAFCSFDPTKCGTNNRTIMSTNNSVTVYTSLAFTASDVCPYVIVTDPDLEFNVYITISVNQIINSEVYLLTGISMDSISSQTKLTLTMYKLDPAEYYMIVVIP